MKSRTTASFIPVKLLGMTILLTIVLQKKHLVCIIILVDAIGAASITAQTDVIYFSMYLIISLFFN